MRIKDERRKEAKGEEEEEAGTLEVVQPPTSRQLNSLLVIHFSLRVFLVTA